MTDRFTPSIPPASTASFEELVTCGRPFVDKTAFLNPLLHSGCKVTQFLRPRGFGRSLSMDMLASFVEMNYQDPGDTSRQERLFQGLDVLEDQELCSKFMGSYPVIKLSLGDVGGTSFPEAVQSMLSQLRELFAKFSFLQDSPKQPDEIRQSLHNKLRICTEENFALLSEGNLSTSLHTAWQSLAFLSDILFCEYGKQSIIIVDDYDVPLQQGTAHGYYKEILEAVIGMMGHAMKGNASQMKGFFTGCINIAHQSIFGGFNNYVTFGPRSHWFTDFMGFTREETAELLREYSMEERLPEVIEWYGGYSMDGPELLCPASVMNFIADAKAPGSNPATLSLRRYRDIPSDREIIEACMNSTHINDCQRLQALIDGSSETISLTCFTTYPRITGDTRFDSTATLLLGTGCFTMDPAKEPLDWDKLAIRIPNREILCCFQSVADQLFSSQNHEWREQAVKLRDSLLDGATDKVWDAIGIMLENFIAFRSNAHENYYQCFLTGVLNLVSTEDVSVTSTPERGGGYSAITLRRKSDQTAVIIEYKESEDGSFATLDKVSDKALEHLQASQYKHLLEDEGFTRILSYGLGFTGRDCVVTMADPE